MVEKRWNPFRYPKRLVGMILVLVFMYERDISSLPFDLDTVDCMADAVEYRRLYIIPIIQFAKNTFYKIISYSDHTIHYWWQKADVEKLASTVAEMMMKQSQNGTLLCKTSSWA